MHDKLLTEMTVGRRGVIDEIVRARQFAARGSHDCLRLFATLKPGGNAVIPNIRWGFHPLLHKSETPKMAIRFGQGAVAMKFSSGAGEQVKRQTPIG
jgi:hypothetical protein